VRAGVVTGANELEETRVEEVPSQFIINTMKVTVWGEVKKLCEVV